MTPTAPAATSTMPFGSARGRGLRIAVIDTGVNACHPHIYAKTRGFVPGADAGESWDDSLGHGTAVMAAIQEKAPLAEYTAVKLFSNSLRSTSGRLMQALAWTIENRFDIVNLSLGTPNLESRARLQGMIDCAAAVGVILISARRAGDQPVLPGILPGVIGVDVDWDLPRDRYRIEAGKGTLCFFASGFPRPLPGMIPARNLNGISFAVANMTGFVARACEGRSDRRFKQVCEALTAESLRIAARDRPSPRE
jgi:hypothetical protein